MPSARLVGTDRVVIAMTVKLNFLICLLLFDGEN
jgi:hypothetical protein